MQLIVLPDGWLPLGRPAEGAAIDACTDAEAASMWLRAKGGRSANTFAAYRKEAVRLLLWLAEQHLALADLRVEHVHLYYAHLASPPRHWIRPRKPRRDETLLPTQVLAGPLQSKSIAYTRRVLGQMCGYLQDAGYLARNVFRLSIKQTVITETVQTRLLDLDSWHWFWKWLIALPQKTPADCTAARSRWVFALLYHSGIRREEVAHGRMGDFVRTNREWSLRVLGKGSKERFVSVNSALLRELIQYRKSQGLPDYPAPGEQFPLVASVHITRRGTLLTPRAVGLLVKTIANQASASCDDAHIRAQLTAMTTHWMRHTNATHRLLAGASLETTQDELGHDDPRTTRIYAKTSDHQRHRDAEALAELTIESMKR